MIVSDGVYFTVKNVTSYFHALLSRQNKRKNKKI